jgi:uncharacterized protein YqeY
MKLDILTKQRIDKWFSEVTADELLYINKKYLTQDQSLQLIQPVVNHRRELLKAFQDHYQSNLFDDERTFDWNIDNFLEAFNCG